MLEVYNEFPFNELECIFETCEQCPAWTGTTCSGELEVTDGTEIQRTIPDGNNKGCDD